MRRLRKDIFLLAFAMTMFLFFGVIGSSFAEDPGGVPIGSEVSISDSGVSGVMNGASEGPARDSGSVLSRVYSAQVNDYDDVGAGSRTGGTDGSSDANSSMSGTGVATVSEGSGLGDMGVEESGRRSDGATGLRVAATEGLTSSEVTGSGYTTTGSYTRKSSSVASLLRNGAIFGYYDTLNSAVYDSADGDEVVLLSNLSITNEIVIDRNITIRSETSEEFNSKKFSSNDKEISTKINKNMGESVSKLEPYIITVNISEGQNSSGLVVKSKNNGLKLNRLYLASTSGNNARLMYVDKGAKLYLDTMAIFGISSSIDGPAIYSDGGEIYGDTKIIIGFLNEKFTNRSRSGTAIYARKGSKITISNGAFSYNKAKENGGAIYVEDSEINFNQCEFVGNYSINGKGAAIYAVNSKVVLDDCKFESNRAMNGDGGALYLGNCEVSIKDSTFLENQAQTGGAIYFTNPKNVTILDNNFTKNTAFYTKSVKIKESHGGAINFVSDNKEDKFDFVVKGNGFDKNYAYGNGGAMRMAGSGQYTFRLTNNIMTKNGSDNRGGAISFIMYKPSVLDIQSGLFEANYASVFGGAIDYTSKDSSPLVLKNIIIIGNRASRGAGIWLCPTSSLEMYSTLGGTITKNIAENDFSSMASGTLSNIKSTGDDIRFESIDTDDKLALMTEGGNFDPKDTNHFLTLVKYGLAGIPIYYYRDDVDSRFIEGTTALSEKDLYLLDVSRGFHTYTEMGEEMALIIMKDNYTGLRNVGNLLRGGRGGAIASNSSVIIGQENSDIQLTLQKKWTASVHPNEVNVRLLMNLKSNGSVEATEVVSKKITLSEDNNWTQVLKNLPKLIYKNGKIYECEYSVVELDSSKWIVSYDSKIEGQNQTITVVNSPRGTIPKTETIQIVVKKQWVGNNKAESVKFDLVKIVHKADGDDRQVLHEGVELSDANNWTYVFFNLVKEEKIGDDTFKVDYDVVEYEMLGWDTSYEVMDLESISQKIFTITNTENGDRNPQTPKKTINKIPKKHKDEEQKKVPKRVPKYPKIKRLPRTADGRSLEVMVLVQLASVVVVSLLRKKEFK